MAGSPLKHWHVRREEVESKRRQTRNTGKKQTMEGNREVQTLCKRAAPNKRVQAMPSSLRYAPASGRA